MPGDACSQTYDRAASGICVTDQDVLYVIETICGDDFCEDMEMQAATANLPDDLKTAVSKLGEIYRLAHAHVKAHPCYAIHADWRKEADRG